MEALRKRLLTLPRRQIMFAIATIVLWVIFRFATLTGQLFSNLAWMQLSRAKPLEETTNRYWASKAIGSFQRAIEFDSTDHWALIGMGVAYLTLDQEEAAFSSWEEAAVGPEILMGLAKNREVARMWDEALIYYRGASLMNSEEAPFLAGNACQHNLAYLENLIQSNYTYCHAYFKENNNWIVNGQFDTGSLTGWGERYFAQSDATIYHVEQAGEEFGFAAQVKGLNKEYHGGIFQQIALPLGKTIHYSAWIEVKNTEDASVRILYYGGNQNNKPFGNDLTTITSDIEWTYFERTFEVPETDTSLVTLFPVLLTGRGEILIDDVRIEVLSD